MNLEIFTLVLDARPFITQQKEMFDGLIGIGLNARWHIIEGVADSVLDTSWVAKIPPRLSRDGTTEILNSRVGHPRISIHRRQLWPGKTAMCNTALATIKEPCILMQLDVDEIWNPLQIVDIMELMATTHYDSLQFICRYMLGENIIATGMNCWSNRVGEWTRVWRFTPGQVFLKHEPPILEGSQKKMCPKNQTAAYGMIFTHYAYALRKQAEFKERYYKYPNLVAQWDRLQANQQWPVKRLADYFPFVGEGVGADILR